MLAPQIEQKNEVRELRLISAVCKRNTRRLELRQFTN